MNSLKINCNLFGCTFYNISLILKIDLQKERNKRNAKKSRKKKKNYIETLEKQVSDLRGELEKARQEIAMYRAREDLYQIGSKSGYCELIQTQKLIKEKSDIVIDQK